MEDIIKKAKTDNIYKTKYSQYCLARLRLIYQIVLLSIKGYSAYRANMLLSFIIAPLTITAQYFIWKSFLHGVSSIRGMTFSMMMSYYAYIMIVNIFVSDNTGFMIRQEIYRGSLVSMLIKPVHQMYFFFFDKIGKKIVSIFFEMIPLFVIYTVVFKIDLRPFNTFWAVISVLLSFIHTFLINFCIGITAFWLINNFSLHMIVGFITSICSGFLIPLSLFPVIIQKFLFILPFNFMYYIPVRVLLGSYELAGVSMSIPQIVTLQFGYLIIMFMITNLLWKKGIKKFMGVGT